ncbi:hypothetical protein SDC9_94886 [bioreactor metagenome]|uniref:Uncharacterized protein n=1 Tax=bioreactor metagenome TaxID=1076179 RepID=A0A645ABF2_9ZZZZ
MTVLLEETTDGMNRCHRVESCEETRQRWDDAPELTVGAPGRGDTPGE